MNLNIGTGATINGKYKFQVVEGCKVVEDRPWSENIILNQGLNNICTGILPSFPAMFAYHAIGTGTGSVLATDVGLGNETKRTNTYVTGTGNTGRSNIANAVTFRWTFDHTLEVSNANYTEHGLSYTATAGNNLLTRALISGGTLTVLTGQQARCIYDITVTVTPGTSTALTVGGTGWPVAGVTNCDGNYIIGSIDYALGTLSTNGVAGVLGTRAWMIGGSSTFSVCAVNNITLPSFGSTPSLPGGVFLGVPITYSMDSYTAGTFTFTNRPSSYASAAAWASTSIMGWAIGDGNQGLYFKYTYQQTKANTHRLRYPSVTVTWARA